ncbi:MAG: DNA-damage-inducible protein F [uncultured Thiotrichaceae bacterium]|uniref:DNA-damage-inducible protein F n=1 Tax=uncultured Thiotrichaceae bacterium TaxID=298394 RepID=A0A6S6U1A5_9GAMM|nr:MAG: DNA-damage-inducible protein F [uncultured Thiotrichaceae bacterium]
MAEQERLPTTKKEWHQRVLFLAWPIILSNLSIPLVGAVDTAVVGQLSHPRFMAAVAIGAIIFSSTFWIFGFLRMGTTGFVSQAYGRDDDRQVSLAFFRAGLIALVLGGLFILLQKPIAWLAFHFIGAEPDVLLLAEEYYAIRVWSAPATFLNYCILGVLIGMQRMRLVLLTQLVLNGCNIALDIAFVNGLGMDVDGVALSSLLSEYIAVLFGLWLLRKQLFYLREIVLSDIVQLDALKALFVVNGNLFLRTLLLMSAFYFFTAQGARFGTVVLAANAVLINMLHFLAYGLDGFAQAAEALVGGAYGKKQRQTFHTAVKVSSLWAFIMAVLIALLYAAFGENFIRTLTSIEEVINIANEYRYWLVLAPIVAVWSYQFDGIYIGATQTKVMRDTMAISLIIYIISAYVLMHYFDNHGLWAALMIFLLMRGITMAMHYPRLLNRL